VVIQRGRCDAGGGVDREAARDVLGVAQIAVEYGLDEDEVLREADRWLKKVRKGELRRDPIAGRSVAR
jgi:hypothetical protein